MSLHWKNKFATGFASFFSKILSFWDRKVLPFTIKLIERCDNLQSLQAVIFHHSLCIGSLISSWKLKLVCDKKLQALQAVFIRIQVMGIIVVMWVNIDKLRSK